MNILMKLKNSKVLSNNEKIIADYILEHPDRILKMTAKDLSTVCYVSTATIYRLCDKLELSGFADLKLKITSSLEEYLKILTLIFLLSNFRHIMKLFIS